MRFVTNFFFLLALQLVAAHAIDAQTSDWRFEVPSKYVSLILVDDPACPIRLSGPTRVIAYSNGALSFGYNITNKSNANVESLSFREIDWFGNSSYDHPSTVRVESLFSPDLTDYTLSEKEAANREFDESVAAKYGIISRPNRFWVAMVVKVKLSDGTVYDASRKYGELSDFLNQPFSKAGMTGAELDQREKKLLDFIANLFSSK